MFEFNRSLVPKNPGVYIFKDKLNNIIYVGKAKNLQNRVSSYFQKNLNSIKTEFLVKNINDVEFIVVDNEVEALLLENKLIKKNKPKYNINLKDNKTYPYIKITNDKIPKIYSTRKVFDDGALYFGPFSDGILRNELIDICVRLFGLINNKTYSSKSKLNYQIGLAPAEKLSEIKIDYYKLKVKDAIDFLNGKNIPKLIKKLKDEMNLFSENLDFEKANEKKKQIELILKLEDKKQKVDLLKNYDEDVVVIIEDDLKQNSTILVLNISKGTILSKNEFKFKNYDENLFEDFLKMYYSNNSVPKEILVNLEFWKDENELTILNNYFSNLKKSKCNLINPKKGEKLALVNLALKNAELNFGKENVLVEMKNKLKLKNTPVIIDCYDMSNFGSDDLVGACVRFVDEKEEKQDFRKFNIKSFSGKNDDFGAMKEVLRRRYLAIIEGRDKSIFPDLILVDGGLGQFNIAKNVLEELNLINKIDLISVAKGEKRDKNEIYLIDSNEPLIFDNNSKMILYIRKIRDRVHDFVIKFNRSKRKI